MAEAILAFSIAANVIQFIDFGCKILSTSYQIHNKYGHGASQKNHDLEDIAIDLHKITDDLEFSLPQETMKQKPSPNEHQLQQLAQRCRDVCLELVSALDKLKAPGQPQKWTTFQAALRTVWRENKIEALRRRLEEFRQEIVVRILISFRDQMSESNAKQTSIMDKVDLINVSTRGLGEKFLDYIEQCKESHQGCIQVEACKGGNFIDSIEKSKESHQGCTQVEACKGEKSLDYIKQGKESHQDCIQVEACKRWQADLINAIHQDNASARERGSFIGDSVTHREQQLQGKFLEHLSFAEISDRHSRIAEAYEKTFQWIYRDPCLGQASWESFVQWLEGDSSLYWNTGKAGSGKSTLMKYLYNDPRTCRHLKAWTSEVRLVSAAFFFWNSGTDMQMSQMGLLRSILFQTLRQTPSLIQHIFPERWEAYSLFSDDHLLWTQPELRKAFQLLAKHDVPGAKFCFFIDGLDEFEGEHTNLIDLFRDVGPSPHVKICVSSRPWVVFEDAFQNKPSLMLQDLTYPDIKHYTDSSFHSHVGFAELERREPQYASQLLEAVARKAAGVFLWVRLVVRSLLAGLVNGDRVSDLERRLEFLPPDLQNLYEKMLNSLDAFYFEHASQLFQIVRAAVKPPTLLDMSFADEEPSFVVSCKVRPLGDEEKSFRADVMRRRLNSRCKGLLEVASCSSRYQDITDSSDALTVSSLPSQDHGSGAAVEISLADITVQYLHRTVKDFLESQRVWTRILAATQNRYSPLLALCRSFITQFKVMSPNSLSRERFWHAIRRCMYYPCIIDTMQSPNMVQQNSRGDQDQDSLVTILDEFDRAATELVNTPTRDGSTFMQRERSSMARNWKGILQPNWTSTYSSDERSSIGLTFLSLAVKLDLRSYVRAKVKKACLVKQDNGVWPLLNDAITFDEKINEVLGVYSFPSIKMVSVLFEQGANPNWKVSISTVWENLLANVNIRMSGRLRALADQNEMSNWMGVIEVFLENGADSSLDLRSYLATELRGTPSDQSNLATELQRTPRTRLKELLEKQAPSRARRGWFGMGTGKLYSGV